MIPWGRNRPGKVKQGGKDSQWEGALLSYFLLRAIGTHSRPARSHIDLSSEKKGLFIYWFLFLTGKVPYGLLILSHFQVCTCFRMADWIPAGMWHAWLWQRKSQDRKWEECTTIEVMCLYVWFLQQCSSERWRDCRQGTEAGCSVYVYYNFIKCFSLFSLVDLAPK